MELAELRLAICRAARACGWDARWHMPCVLRLCPLATASVLARNALQIIMPCVKARLQTNEQSHCLHIRSFLAHHYTKYQAEGEEHTRQVQAVGMAALLYRTSHASLQQIHMGAVHDRSAGVTSEKQYYKHKSLHRPDPRGVTLAERSRRSLQLLTHTHSLCSLST